MPVLPLVASITVWPGFSSPLASARSITARAMRSLTEPMGLKDSTLTYTFTPSGASLCSLTRGVRPIVSRMFSYLAIALSSPSGIDMGPSWPGSDGVSVGGSVVFGRAAGAAQGTPACFVGRTAPAPIVKARSPPVRPMTTLELRFLGEFGVIRDGRALPLPPSKKTRALLAYLCMHGRRMRRDQLCELLWEVPDDPRGSLRWSLSKLRRLLDDDEREIGRAHV